MSGYRKVVQKLEQALLVLALALLGMFAVAHANRVLMVRMEMAQFGARRDAIAAILAEPTQAVGSDRLEPPAAGTALWSSQRAKAYAATLSKSVEPLAVLRIPRLSLEAPVLNGTDHFTLNRGVGRIRGTSRPGQSGNIGIAGHRDGFFRSLKDVRTGDTIELVTTSGTDIYVVDRVRITNPADISVLRLREKPSLTLVTCYPFYFVGPAPRRFVVEASLKEKQ